MTHAWTVGFLFYWHLCDKNQQQQQQQQPYLLQSKASSPKYNMLIISMGVNTRVCVKNLNSEVQSLENNV